MPLEEISFLGFPNRTLKEVTKSIIFKALEILSYDKLEKRATNNIKVCYSNTMSLPEKYYSERFLLEQDYD